MRRRHLIVFARQSRLGRGKTRLAAGIGRLEAWRFSRLVLAALLRRLGGDPRWTLTVAVAPDRAAAMRGWPPGAGRRVAQGGGDLGRRMARALAAPPPGPAVLVGSDIPDIRAPHIVAAFRALGRHDAVFGPAGDGGYWLVGVRRLRALPRGMFAGVRWSSPHALADSVASLPRRHAVGLVDTLDDVDDAAGWRRWRAGSR
ncbi:DUF2064 domain-containing protein [Azospirillum sp. RWY-5-1]|uniref:DUF2064 domain-containing protein n=1 Tax=Azospirillum oleiclasticum TaxID=2735135 RepID=A0ABX2T6U6_9PROT|nr:TIGR04282 family arsenosugar biosynthesis glycosyltransferase [Azospirillum oleiclasticum]NYZ11712.1 DUF2064 domain-containing protein [Azospirillum oleiclasticum]NYZ18873.1 DUF2064 domain-containing protein [Azospirillum oleiclasticum]